MAKTRTPKQRLTELANAIPSDTAIHTTMIALDSQANSFADYAIAVVGAGLIEKALEVVILTRFVALNPDERGSIFDYIKQGPLCDLSSRIKISYALGLFGPRTRDDLEHIRTIRNSFAHSLKLLRFEPNKLPIYVHSFTHRPRSNSSINCSPSWRRGHTSPTLYRNDGHTGREVEGNYRECETRQADETRSCGNRQLRAAIDMLTASGSKQSRN